MRRFEWRGVRFATPDAWDIVLVDNGVLVAGPQGETLTIARRRESIDRVQARWDRDLRRYPSQVISEQRESTPVAGLLRVMAVGDPPRTRIMTQLFIGGRTTVTASYAADADDSYDRDEADAVIRSIRVKH